MYMHPDGRRDNVKLPVGACIGNDMSVLGHACVYGNTSLFPGLIKFNTNGTKMWTIATWATARVLGSSSSSPNFMVLGVAKRSISFDSSVVLWKLPAGGIREVPANKVIPLPNASPPEGSIIQAASDSMIALTTSWASTRQSRREPKQVQQFDPSQIPQARPKHAPKHAPTPGEKDRAVSGRKGTRTTSSPSGENTGEDKKGIGFDIIPKKFRTVSHIRELKQDQADRALLALGEEPGDFKTLGLKRQRIMGALSIKTSPPPPSGPSQVVNVQDDNDKTKRKATSFPAVPAVKKTATSPRHSVPESTDDKMGKLIDMVQAGFGSLNSKIDAAMQKGEEALSQIQSDILPRLQALEQLYQDGPPPKRQIIDEKRPQVHPPAGGVQYVWNIGGGNN